jgi:uracil phosphoribosyltransferase
VAVMQESHPEVEIFCASLDEKLNERFFIVPGLGDFGDRLFGTN